MWKQVIALVSTGLLAGGCAFTPSQLNAAPASYDGVTLIVRGYVDLSRGSHVLYDSQARFRELEAQRESGNREEGTAGRRIYCVSIANPELLYKNPEVFSTRSATFKAKFIAGNREGDPVDRGACPVPSSIVVDYADLKRRYRLPSADEGE